MPVAVALAVANRKGARFSQLFEATLPENAGDWCRRDIASDERDGLHAVVREVVYDGRSGDCGQRWISRWTAKSLLDGS